MIRPAFGWFLLLPLAIVSCHSGEPAPAPRPDTSPPARTDPPKAPPPAAVAPAAPRPSWVGENPDGSGLAPSKHGPDEVVAVVEGESLTMQSLVDNALEWWGDKTLEEMIFRALMEHDRARIGITADAADLGRRADKWLDDLDQQIASQSGGKSGLKDLLASKGETREAYKAKLVADENFDRQLLLELLIAYDLRMQERIEVQDIHVESPEKAKEVLDKLAMQADFARLAQDESIDMRTAQVGGKVPAFARGMGPFGREYEEAAFALAPGQLSAPVADPRRGYHVIRCLSKTAPRQAAWADAKSEVWAQVLRRPPTSDEIALWITRRRELAKAQVEVKWRYGVEER